MSEVADYLASLDDTATRAAVEHVYELARREVPDATEGRSYGMAALRYRGRPLVASVATKNHLSVFPFSPPVVDAVASELEGFDMSKGTIRFTTASPIPDGVLKRIVTLRRDEIDAALDR